jgi:hypothetical protein
LDAILRERQLHSRLFVAECDIKSFFDCVPHAVAIGALRALIIDSEMKISLRALEIFDAYLSRPNTLGRKRICGNCIRRQTSMESESRRAGPCPA